MKGSVPFEVGPPRVPEWQVEPWAQPSALANAPEENTSATATAAAKTRIPFTAILPEVESVEHLCQAHVKPILPTFHRCRTPRRVELTSLKIWPTCRSVSGSPIARRRCA